MDIKIGDRVKFQNSPMYQFPRDTITVRYGTVIRVEDGKWDYYYKIMEDGYEDSDLDPEGFTHVIAPHMGDKIEKDVKRMREEKLNEILYV